MRPIPLLALVVVTLACGSAAQQRRAESFGELRAYTFQKPLDEVWPVAVKIFEANLDTKREAGDHRLESEWSPAAYSGVGSGRKRDQRIVLEGEALDAQRCRVMFMTDMKWSDQPLAEPSLSGVVHEKLQLALIRNFDPATADRLEK